jgi:hypothetical protein
MAAPDRHRAVALPADTIAEGVRRRMDCAGLSLARRARACGLVHRDVKPATSWSVDSDHDFVKELDFGLVKHTHDGQTVTALSIARAVVRGWRADRSHR